MFHQIKAHNRQQNTLVNGRSQIQVLRCTLVQYIYLPKRPIAEQCERWLALNDNTHKIRFLKYVVSYMWHTCPKWHVIYSRHLASTAVPNSVFAPNKIAIFI